jgi:hypothetical protein
VAKDIADIVLNLIEASNDPIHIPALCATIRRLRSELADIATTTRAISEQIERIERLVQ